MLNERLANIIVDKLPIDREEDRIKYLKCKFGIQSVLIDIVKIVAVYGIAIFLDMLIPVLLFQIGYLLVRSFGYGAHAAKNTICTLVSIVTFVGVPYLIKNYYSFDRNILIGLLIINFIIIALYAPSSTKLNPIEDLDKRRKFKILTLVSNLCILAICIINNNEITNNYLVLGSFIACLFMLPITHTILKGGNQSEKN